MNMQRFNLQQKMLKNEDKYVVYIEAYELTTAFINISNDTVDDLKKDA